MSAVRLYVAGPMTGYVDFNFQQFHAVAKALREMGYEVENPAETEHPEGQTWDGYMRAALLQVVACDGVALLSNWQASRGAALEVHVAHALGMTCLPWGEWYSHRVQKPPRTGQHTTDAPTGLHKAVRPSFTFGGSRYVEAPESSSCDGCAFDLSSADCYRARMAAGARFGVDCFERGVIYIRAEEA